MNLLETDAIFRLHSGRESCLRIECDALDPADLRSAANLLLRVLPPFGDIEGILTGGAVLAELMRPHASHREADPYLIVDDVWTTGSSMRRTYDLVRQKNSIRPIIGAVIFARGPLDPWVTPLFTLNERLWSA